MTCFVSASAASGPRATSAASSSARVSGSSSTTSSASPMRSASSALHLTTGQAQLLGPARPDEAGQPLRAAAAGDDPEQDLGLTEHGPRSGDAVVAGQRQLAAAAEGVAADGGDDEPGDGGDGVERVVEAGRDRSGLVGAAELGDVGAGGEDALAAGDDDGAGRIGGQRRRRLAELGQEGPGEGVDLAVGQRDDGDAVVTAIEGEQLCHGASLAHAAPAVPFPAARRAQEVCESAVAR